MTPPHNYKRTLTFRSHDLGADSVFVLSFRDDKMAGMYKTVFPTVFKVTAFGEAGDYEFKVVYRTNFGFTRTQVTDDDVIVPASTFVHMNHGEQTILTKAGDPAIYSFSKPERISPSTPKISVKNSTDSKENIGLGCFEKLDHVPSEILVFGDVGPGSSVDCQFTPTLEGYVASGYQEGAILRTQVKSAIIFAQNLDELEGETDWLITFNSGNNSYTVMRDFSQY